MGQRRTTTSLRGNTAARSEEQTRQRWGSQGIPMRRNTQGRWRRRTRTSWRRFSPSVVLRVSGTTTGTGLLRQVLHGAEGLISRHKVWGLESLSETALEEVIGVLKEARKKLRAPAIYISGPMTGLPNLNMEAFNEAERKLRKAGWSDIRNPARLAVNEYENLPRSLYLRSDLRQLLDCQAILLLRGWQRSKGARLEALIADEVGIRRLYEIKKDKTNDHTKRVNHALNQAIHHPTHECLGEGKKTGDQRH